LKNNWLFPVTFIAATVGVLMAVQFKTQASYRQDLPSRRPEDLVMLVKDAEIEKKRLAAQADALVKQIKDAQAGATRTRTVLPARWGALEGSGIEVTIDDSQKPLAKGENPNIAIVHNEDLLKIVNELRAAGAEALSVNDQRLVEVSEISCAGPTILVNKSRVVPPFVISAIGDPQTMVAALKLRGGVVEGLQFYGIQVNITEKPNVVVPMYRGGAAYKYAKPLTPKKTS
jgi:uncharacterized protein YlxW (UPF0749 family)